MPDHMAVEGSEQALAAALRDGTLHIVSDGAYHWALGTVSAVLAMVDGCHCIWADCQATGYGLDQSMHRSKLMGIYMAWRIVDWLAVVHQVQGEAEFACNGKLAGD